MFEESLGQRVKPCLKTSVKAWVLYCTPLFPALRKQRGTGSLSSRPIRSTEGDPVFKTKQLELEILTTLQKTCKSFHPKISLIQIDGDVFTVKEIEVM